METPSPNLVENPESTPSENNRGDAFDPIVSQWKLMWFMIIACLLLSVSCNIYFLKQNRILFFQKKQQMAQLNQLEQAKANLLSLLQDVGNFGAKDPEVLQLLMKYGVNINFVPPPAATTPPPIPTPPAQN